HIQSIRKKHGLTLSNLAEQSGVSMATLSQIEANKVNPTIATLWKIAAGLEVELNSLLSGLENRHPLFEVLRSEEIAACDTLEKGVSIRVFSPLSMAENLEIYRLNFDPGACLNSEAHLPRTEEYLTVLKGRILVKAGGKKATLEAGDFIRYQADLEHGICNTGEAEAEINMIVRFFQ
ncbi:MAG TPA: XRE family transcriptional regulator, partial [Sediminispirochaeta sp.]|nr:XRE family transcriptional regulator [Sediminispirochaeta sp.]